MTKKQKKEIEAGYKVYQSHYCDTTWASHYLGNFTIRVFCKNTYVINIDASELTDFDEILPTANCPLPTNNQATS